MQKLPKTLPAFFWHFLRKKKSFPICIILNGILYGVLLSLLPIALKFIIDSLSTSSSSLHELLLPCSIYLLIWTFQALNHRWADWIYLKNLPVMRAQLVESMFAYLNRHSYSFFQNNFAGSLSNKVSDMSNAFNSILRQLDDYLSVFIALLIAIVTMAIIHPVFTTIITFWMFLLGLTTYFFNKKTILLSKAFSESRSTLIGNIADSISNFINLIAFSRHSFENKHIHNSLDTVTKNDSSLQWHILLMRTVQDLSFVTLIAGMLASLLFLHTQNKVTPGDFALILTLSISISQNVWWVVNRLNEFSEEIGRASQALSTITQPHEIVDSENAKEIEINQGIIQFDNVSFTYDQNTKIFKNKSVTIQPHQKIGLVGFSGAGKSSFVNLILRFFDPQSGKILIDGQNIAKVSQDSLRRNISYIPQDTSLFHRSLLENIQYGNPHASQTQIIQAAKNAYAHEFIKSLPEQYNTLVGERGIKLSGGQRQRIAIARAFLKNAPILILDEATSALDSQTEALIQKSLEKLIQNRTTIVIAHRLSTLSQMDRILVFHQGEITQDGSHNTLINQPGHYQSLYKMQSQGFLPE